MDLLTSIWQISLEFYTYFVIGYFVVINFVYFVMLVFSYLSISEYLRRNYFCDYRTIIQSEFSTPISVLAPAYNEEATVVESVQSLLKLQYSTMEVIVVNDGSKDKTLEILIRHFGLKRSRRVYIPELVTKNVRGIYISQKSEFQSLIVIDKENGGKADALNVGINVARYPLVCAIDADSILEDDALLKVAKPFFEFNDVIAVGGIVRIANGCEIDRGRIKVVHLSKKWIAVFQVVEYLRAFLSGRMGWTAINGLLIISGAFGLFRKDIVVACGGYKHDTVGEDMELVTRMHRYMKERKLPYRVVFVPDPVCWTEAPESMKILSRQRNRWHRGLLDTLLIHKRILFNPRYGVIGMLAAPYYLLFELLGPVFEGVGYIVVLISVLLNIINIEVFLLFFTVSVIYGVMFSVGAVLLEEMSFHRYTRPFELMKLIFFALIENFGYRQITVWWRMKAFWDYFRGIKSWGTMQRKGFSSSSSV